MPTAIVTHDSYGYIDKDGLQRYAARGDEIDVTAAELKRGQETGGLAASQADADKAAESPPPLETLTDVADEPYRVDELTTPEGKPVGKVERAGGSPPKRTSK